MNVAQTNQLWASVLADHLQRPVVISPGSRNTPLVLAYATRSKVPLHCILDERAAAFFALGLARASGQAVVLVCTSLDQRERITCQRSSKPISAASLW